MFESDVKHMSGQHKQSDNDVSYSKVHQKIIHGSLHLFDAVDNQAHKGVTHHVNHNQ